MLISVSPAALALVDFAIKLVNYSILSNRQVKFFGRGPSYRRTVINPAYQNIFFQAG